jgi:hypothetical protein
MDKSLVDVYVALFDWSIQKPLMPQLGHSPYYKEMEDLYEKYKLKRDAYMDKFDAVVNAYKEEQSIINLRKKLVDEFENIEEAAYDAAFKEALPLILPYIEKGLLTMKKTVMNELSTPAECLVLSQETKTKISYKLCDIKNEELMHASEFVHKASLYACECFDQCCKELIEIMNELEFRNSFAYNEIIENFRYDLKNGSTIEDALLNTKTVYIPIMENNNIVLKSIILTTPVDFESLLG